MFMPIPISDPVVTPPMNPEPVVSTPVPVKNYFSEGSRNSSNIFLLAMKIFMDTRDNKEMDAQGALEKLDGINKSNAALRTKISELNGILAKMDPSKKTATQPITADMYNFLKNSGITVEGKSIADVFNNGNSPAGNYGVLTEVVSGLDNLKLQKDSDSSKETNNINLYLSSMNSAMDSCVTVRKAYERAGQGVTN